MLKQIKNMTSKTTYFLMVTVVAMQSATISVLAQASDSTNLSVGIGVNGKNPDAYGGTYETKVRRKYLYNLGSNDVSAEIEESLQKKLYRGEINRRQLIDNRNAYQVVNAARELSLLIMESLDTQRVDTRRATELAQFAAKLIAMKPLPPSIKISSDILEMKDGEEKIEALAKENAKEREIRMNEHKKLLISDIVWIMHQGRLDMNAAELQRIDKYATEIVVKMYHGDSVGNGEYLGTNLARLLRREEVLKARTDISYTQIMKDELRTQHKLFLENYIGDTVAFENKQGQVVYEKVSRGDEILTRYLARGSLQISWAAIPANLRLRWKARYEKMLGNPLSGLFYGKESDLDGKLTFWMGIKDRIAQSGVLRQGFSHIGVFEVLVDPSTQEKAVYVYHNIPNDVADVTQEEVRTGGLVRVPIGKFINPAHHIATYIAKMDDAKFYQWAMKSKKKNGYQKEFYRLNKITLNGVLPEKTSEETTWKTTISQEDYNKLYSEQSPKVLKEKVMNLYMNKLNEYLTQRGITFHWPEPPLDFLMPEALYCNLTLDAAMREGAGLSLDEYGSQWHWVLKRIANIADIGEWLKKDSRTEKIGNWLLGLPQVEKAKKTMKLDILAPINTAVQDYMDGKTILFPTRTPGQRVKSDYATYDPINIDFANALSSKSTLSRFDHKKFDVVSEGVANMNDHHYVRTLRSEDGLKNPKDLAEEIAKSTTEKAKVIYMDEMKQHLNQVQPNQ